MAVRSEAPITSIAKLAKDYLIVGSTTDFVKTFTTAGFSSSFEFNPNKLLNIPII